MDKYQIAAALRNARLQKDMTCKEVAVILGKSEKTVSAWEHCNGQPDLGMLIRLCGLYKYSGLDELLGLSRNNPEVLRIEEKDLIGIYRRLNTNSKQVLMTVAQMELNHVRAERQGEIPIKILQQTNKSFIKVYNQSAAAGYGSYIDDESFETIAVPCIPHGSEFGVRISGDSMSPRIKDGDIVFVKRQPSIEAGDIGVFIYDNEAYCKQLAYKDNAYYLHSLNSKYRDIPVSSDSVYCVGRVLG